MAEVRTGRGNSGLVRGEMRDVGRTRPGKAKGSRGKSEHEGRGGAGSKGRQQVENSVMDEDQGNTGAMRSEEEEENHREDVRKLVEKKQKEEDAQEGGGAEWPPTWWLVAHTSRPYRSQKEKRYKGRDGLTVRTMKEREKKREIKRQRKRQGKKPGKRS